MLLLFADIGVRAVESILTPVFDNLGVSEIF